MADAKCKVCGKSASFGFSPPGLGPRPWTAWACEEHRGEVEAGWLKWIAEQRASSDTGAKAAQPGPGGGEGVSRGAPGSEQGTLDL